MPHGAGFAGGGGGYSGGGGYYGGGYYGHGRGGRCDPFGLLIAFVCTFSVGVLLSLSLGLSLGTEPKKISEYTEQYGLTDNFIIPFEGDFCQDLQATSKNVPNIYQSYATLYFLNSHPPLTERESFNISGSVNLDSEVDVNYHSWNFVLNSGSNMSVEVCYQDERITHYDVIFYVIQGAGNFYDWVKDAEEKHAVMRSRLTAPCSTIDYQVQQDSNYYFVFYLDSIHPTGLKIEFQFNRTLYRISQNMVVNNCSFPLDGESSCSMGLSIFSGYTAFFALSTTPPVDYNDGAKIHFSCQPRGWLFAVIVLVVLFAAICILASVLTICLKVVGIKRRCTHSGRCNTNTTTANVELETKSSLKPVYPVQYGSSSPSPPPYKL